MSDTRMLTKEQIYRYREPAENCDCGLCTRALNLLDHIDAQAECVEILKNRADVAEAAFREAAAQSERFRQGCIEAQNKYKDLRRLRRWSEHDGEQRAVWWALDGDDTWRAYCISDTVSDTDARWTPLPDPVLPNGAQTEKAEATES